MRSLFSYLITIFAVIYWGFRVMVSLMYSMQREFICEPLDPKLEIIIIFLTIPCIVFIIRRNMVVTTLYFGMYAAYFGTIVYNSLMGITSEFTIANTTTLLFSAIGVVIPLLIFLDVVIEKSRFQPKDRHTDWYYGNDKYNREMDQRADKNQYKIK